MSDQTNEKCPVCDNLLRVIKKTLHFTESTLYCAKCTLSKKNFHGDLKNPSDENITYTKFTLLKNNILFIYYDYHEYISYASYQDYSWMRLYQPYNISHIKNFSMKDITNEFVNNLLNYILLE